MVEVVVVVGYLAFFSAFSSRTCSKRLTYEVSMRYFTQILKPPQMSPFSAEEHWLYCQPLLNEQVHWRKLVSTRSCDDR